MILAYGVTMFIYPIVTQSYTHLNNISVLSRTRFDSIGYMAAAKKANPTQLSVTVTLDPTAFAYLENNAPEGKVNETLATWTQHFMSQQARGGILLDPTDHDYIASLADGKRFRDSRSLVRAIEKGMKRSDGNFSFTINVDPAHVQPLQEQAALSAMSVEELINGAVNMLMTNGWLWDFSPAGGRHIPFTAEMLAAVEEVCSKKGADSADIAGLIAEDRLMPISRELKEKIKSLLPEKQSFSVSDYAALVSELESARVELKALRTMPREIVAA